MTIYEEYKDLIEFHASHIIEKERPEYYERTNKDISFFECELEKLSMQNPIFSYILETYLTLKKENKIEYDDIINFLVYAGKTEFAVNDKNIITRVKAVILPEYKRHSQSGVYIHELTHALYYQNRIGTEYKNVLTGEELPYLVMLLYYYFSQNDMEQISKESFLRLFITIPYYAAINKNATEERKMNQFYGVIKSINLFSQIIDQKISQKDIEGYLIGKNEIEFDIESEDLFHSYENFLKNYSNYLNPNYTLKL